MSQRARYLHGWCLSQVRSNTPNQVFVPQSDNTLHFVQNVDVMEFKISCCFVKGYTSKFVHLPFCCITSNPSAHGKHGCGNIPHRGTRVNVVKRPFATDSLQWNQLSASPAANSGHFLIISQVRSQSRRRGNAGASRRKTAFT